MVLYKSGDADNKTEKSNDFKSANLARKVVHSVNKAFNQSNVLLAASKKAAQIVDGGFKGKNPKVASHLQDSIMAARNLVKPVSNRI